jgi:hypothetical protein
MMRQSTCFSIILAVGCTIAGCSKPDPTIILGRWKADSVAFDGIRLPIAPNFEVTRNQLILKSPDGASVQALNLSAIRAENDNIELEVKDALGASLVFTVENPGRIHFKVPFIGTDIVFSKQ